MNGLKVVSSIVVLLSMAFPLHNSPLMFHCSWFADMLHLLKIEFRALATFTAQVHSYFKGKTTNTSPEIWLKDTNLPSSFNNTIISPQFNSVNHLLIQTYSRKPWCYIWIISIWLNPSTAATNWNNNINPNLLAMTIMRWHCNPLQSSICFQLY